MKRDFRPMVTEDIYYLLDHKLITWKKVPDYLAFVYKDYYRYRPFEHLTFADRCYLDQVFKEIKKNRYKRINEGAILNRFYNYKWYADGNRCNNER